MADFSFRSYRSEDKQALSAIVEQVWDFGDCAPILKRAMAQTYLEQCLGEANFSAVALDGEEVIGLILYRVKGLTDKVASKFDYQISRLKLQTSKEGRDMLRFLSQLDKLDNNLLESSKLDWQAQIVLLIVHPKTQGRGAGKALLKVALSHLKRLNIENYCLFTDNSCNYRFYDHLGLTKISEGKRAEDESGKERYFLYGGKASDLTDQRG